jgi:hypothetical protein
MSDNNEIKSVPASSSRYSLNFHTDTDGAEIHKKPKNSKHLPSLRKQETIPVSGTGMESRISGEEVVV